MGQIIMSFAYVIIALGVSHTLGSLAEGGHVKLLKLMAWQNLADADDGIVTSTSSSKSTATTSNEKGGVGIQGLLSGYTYMVQLITSEIRKANRIGKHYNKKKKKLIPTAAATTPMAKTLHSSPPSSSKSKYTYMVQLITSEIRKAYRAGQHYNSNKRINKSLVTTPSYTSPSRMLSRYASNLNTSFQEVYINKDHPVNHDVKDDEESSMDWKEYSKLLQKKNKKKKGTKSRWSRVLKNGSGVVYNKFAMMFERVAKSDSEGKFNLELCVVLFESFCVHE